MPGSVGATDPAERYELSSGQEALWMFEQLAPGTAAYHVPLAFRLRGPLRADLLRAALTLVVRRQEVLRTAFREEDGDPYQLVLPPTEAELPLHEVADGAELAAALHQEARDPFDLAAGRPFRLRLFRLGPEEHVLSLVMHHIATDGWSLRVLIDELSAGYAALLAGRAPETVLPELPVPYRRYARWQRECFQGPELEELLSHWAQELQDLPAVDLAPGRSRPRRPTFAADRLVVRLDPGLHRALTQLARTARVSLFSLLGAAFALALTERTGRPDTAFATLLAGRGEPELEPLIGYFVNMVVLRADLADDPAVTALAARLNAAGLAAIDHEVPFGTVVRRLAPARRPGRNPLAQVTLQLRTGGSAPGRPELPGVTSQDIDLYPGQHAFDATVTFIEDGPEFLLSIEYSTEAFNPAWAAGLAEQLHGLLRAALDCPGARASELLASVAHTLHEPDQGASS
ncbi:condensation domain-containing protein [Kitasatospora sp. NPDC096128]|uniref:condensation domain-containing protein n=1 Tax=Kitasatospora sp. NPDC096128 TaxID=3155547 RepID=UPI00332E8152